MYVVDYNKTFAFMAKLNTVRVHLSLLKNLDWSLHQPDIKNTFLNRKLEVFMTLPPKFCKGKNIVRKLKKSLYRLKQSPRACFDQFAKIMRKQGYRKAQSDHIMFLQHTSNGRKTILIVYVNDIIITRDNLEEIKRLKKGLSIDFEVKDLRQMRYFLRMEVARSNKRISVSQR